VTRVTYAAPVGEQKERMLGGELYRSDDPELVAEHRRCRLLVERFNASSVAEAGERRRLLEELLGHLGEDAEIKPPFQCDYGYPISVGARTFVNYGAVVLDEAPVTIGAGVQIATNVQLLTATHPFDPAARHDGWEGAEPITIGDGVWLGGGAIVCPGVTIGEDTVVGAGSVVAKDLPPRVVAVGNPCRPIRDL
jgi:maltose O-acetyltransferase